MGFKNKQTKFESLMCNGFREIHIQKLINKNLIFLTYHLDSPLILPCNIMSYIQSDSLESQLSNDVFLIKICYIVKEISTETCS